MTSKPINRLFDLMGRLFWKAVCISLYFHYVIGSRCDVNADFCSGATWFAVVTGKQVIALFQHAGVSVL